MIVNVHDAKSSLSQLLVRVAAGEEVVIARAGQPVARLVAYDGPQRTRVPGAWKGRVRIAHDFDAVPPEIAAAFGIEA
jgi:prevent-host-death family protein